jgi:hypothetical protein
MSSPLMNVQGNRQAEVCRECNDPSFRKCAWCERHFCNNHLRVIAYGRWFQPWCLPCIARVVESSEDEASSPEKEAEVKQPF